MVRIVVGDEALEAAVDGLLAGRAAQVGILIGRLASSSRDVVVGLVPTPVKEDGSDAAIVVSTGSKQGGSKSRSGASSGVLAIDVDWVAEHACQVSRMLLGGMHVAGIYCVAPDNVFKQSTSVLCQVSKAIVAATKNSIAFADRLVLHIATSPRRLSCRVCSLEPNGNLSLKPCEWKLAKIISNLQCFACSYLFDVSLPIYSTTGADTLKHKLLSRIASESKHIESAEVLIDGSMVQIDSPLGPGSISDGLHDVQLLLPFYDSKRVEVTQSQSPASIMGTVNLKGAVHARAYAFPREPISHAISGLKEDIMASLRNRIELLCEEAEQSTEELDKAVPLLSSCSEDKAEFTCVLPRRVLIPWNGLFICDYLMPTESVKDIEDRCKDLFATELTQPILEPEEFYTPAASPRLAAGMEATELQHATAKPVNQGTRLLGALFAAFIAVLVGLTLAYLANSSQKEVLTSV